jgi:Putative phage holin Dp-1
VTLTDKVYNAAKFVALVLLPALGTLYFALAGIWHGLPAAEPVVGTITAADAFLGVLLHISTATYKSGDAKYDGALTLEPHPDGEGTAVRLTSLDETAVTTKDAVTFKINKGDPPVLP